MGNMSGLKLSNSHIERGLQEKPHLQQYAAKLKALDKDGNGELDLAEVCEVLDEMANIEKQRRLLKWVAFISGLFALLSIASIVGLTYAVVNLSKDTQLDSGSSALVSKDLGTPVGTSQVISSAHADSLYEHSPSQLDKINSIIVPDGDGYLIARVSSIALVPNVSATVTTADGTVYEVTSEGFHLLEKNGTAAGNDTTNGKGGRRKLLNHDAYTSPQVTFTETTTAPIGTPFAPPIGGGAGPGTAAPIPGIGGGAGPGTAAPIPGTGW